MHPVSDCSEIKFITFPVPCRWKLLLSKEMPQCRRESRWEGGRLNSCLGLRVVKTVIGLAEGQQHRGSSGGSMCCRSIQMSSRGPLKHQETEGLSPLSPQAKIPPCLSSFRNPLSFLLLCRACEWLVFSAFLRHEMHQPRMQAARASAEMPKLVCKCVSSCIFKQVSERVAVVSRGV